MAHELTERAGGMTEMAYVGDTPWHGLGQTLKAGAKIEDWLTAAGMDWTIRRAPVHYHADRAATDMRKWDDKQVLLRSDTGAPLGIVSPDYNIVQPYEVLGVLPQPRRWPGLPAGDRGHDVRRPPLLGAGQDDGVTDRRLGSHRGLHAADDLG